MYIFLPFLLHFCITVCRASSGRRVPHISTLANGLNHNQKDSTSTIQSHVFQESLLQLSTRQDIFRLETLSQNYAHEIIFVIEQKNMLELSRILNDVSNPSSMNYAQYLTGQEVADLTFNPAARDAVVTYLQVNGVSSMSETLHGEFIIANAPISVWERVLSTVFYTFNHTQLNGDVEQIIRAESYSIPIELTDHVNCVLNTIEMPVRTTFSHRTPEKMSLSSKRMAGTSLQTPTASLKPLDIMNYYNMTNVFGSIESTQATYSGGNHYFSPAALEYFQKNINIQTLQPALIIGGHASDDYTLDSLEGNLDIQYLMGLSRGSPTSFWHSNGGLSQWLIEVANQPNPPLVLSISYGADESLTSMSEHSVFTMQAMKLSVRGVTILTASGDDGVHSPLARTDAVYCGYQPSFPASNPYVTAIGATSVITYTSYLLQDSYFSIHYDFIFTMS